MGKYIAIQALQLVDADGKRQSIEPIDLNTGSSGLFEHNFDEKEEARLFDLGVIRKPEDLEMHAKPTQIDELVDSREIEGSATEVKTTKGKGETKPKDDGLLG